MKKQDALPVGRSARNGPGAKRERVGVVKPRNGARKPRRSKWFRGDDCNIAPALNEFTCTDGAIEYILKGWEPKAPLIAKDTRIVAFGSCFAANIGNWLADRNYDLLTRKTDDSGVHVVNFGEGMVNSFVLRQQFEWAFEDLVFSEELWHGRDAKAVGYDEEVRQQTREMFLRADLFIITLGLSEVWYNEPTGEVFWRAVPLKKYDPTRHRFRVATVAENRENILEIARIIRRHRPEARIIFTLSPIPLAATFRSTSIMTANAASKASLRAALDEAFFNGMPEEVYYWPSYELVTELFDNRWGPDRRHVHREILSFVMTLFEETWCEGARPPISSAERMMVAHSRLGELTHWTPWLLERAVSPALSLLALYYRRTKRSYCGNLMADAGAKMAERIGGARGRRLARWSSRHGRQGHLLLNVTEN